MKFLTIGSIKDTFSTLPPAISRQLMEATLNWINQQKQAGIILEVYMMVELKRSMVICEHKTAEEAAQTIAAVPMGGFMDFDVYPLADFNVSMKAALESIKRAEHLFPSAPK
jgi:hypothetical protein